jgi:hypothetical protein
MIEKEKSACRKFYHKRIKKVKKSLIFTMHYQNRLHQENFSGDKHRCSSPYRYLSHFIARNITMVNKFDNYQ